MLSRLLVRRPIFPTNIIVRTKRTGKVSESPSAANDESFITRERTAELNVKQVEDAMARVVGSCRDELVKLRIGRAHLSILDGIRVKRSDGTEQSVPINSLGTAMIKDPSTIIVNLWETSGAKALVSAVNSANLNLTAIAESAERVRITVPKLSKESREQMARAAGGIGEQAKRRLRALRQRILDDVRPAIRETDTRRRGELELQRLFEQSMRGLDELVTQKSNELLK